MKLSNKNITQLEADSITIVCSIISKFITDFLFPANYTLQANSNNQYYISSNQDIKISILSLVLFVLLWTVLDYFFTIYIHTHIHKRFSYYKFPVYTMEKLCQTFITARQQTLSLQSIIKSSSHFNSNEAILYIRDLSQIVSLLNTIFCSNKNIQKNYITDAFRDISHPKIKIQKSISRYEFNALLNIIKELSDTISPLLLENSLANDDLTQINAMIDELYDIVNM